MNKEYVFKGYDFYELVECLGEELSKQGLEGLTAMEEEKIMVERLNEYLLKVCTPVNMDKEVIKKVREFLEALCWMGEEYQFPDRHIWDGMRKTEDDALLIRYVTDCVWRLWN